MKYRKKPIVIDAVRWNGWDLEPLHKLVDGAKQPLTIDGAGHVMIYTLEGVMSASEGDWIIKGVKGEFYPCKPDIFDATYEVAE